MINQNTSWAQVREQEKNNQQSKQNMPTNIGDRGICAKRRRAFATTMATTIILLLNTESSFDSTYSILRRKLEGPPVLPLHIQTNLDSASIGHDHDHGTPFYFHILKSGGTSTKDLYATCYRLVVANEVGGKDEAGDEDELQIVDNDGARYVNVDTTEWEGIQRAKRLGFVESRMADVIFSPHVNEIAAELFTPQVPGKMFSMFRDPVERVVSLYYYLQTATWEPTYNPALQQMTLEEYANSTLIESNWMVRTLSGKRTGQLTEEDITLAMQIVKEKCVVGLLDHFEESLERFDEYFGFRPNDDESIQCQKDLLARGGSNSNGSHKREQLDPDSPALKNIQKKNRADTLLYAYVQKLFEEQRHWFKNTGVGKEPVGDVAASANTGLRAA